VCFDDPQTFTTRCVAQPGDIPCPQPFDTNRLVVYGGVSDTRSCSACACAPNVTCGDLTLFACSNCAGSGSDLAVVPLAGCAATDEWCSGFDVFGTVRAYEQAITVGSCIPSGGLEGGALTPSSATTICCE